MGKDTGFKSLLIVGESGDAKGYSVEEALASRVNHWKGWKCSAGFDNIHISADGNVFAATCKVNGLLGNVYDDDMKLPETWITCQKEWCVCGSDMQLRKAKSSDWIERTYERPPSETSDNDFVGSPAWVVPYHFEAHREFAQTLTWDLSRRCNYHCSYCHPAVSNTYEAHKSWGSLKHAADLITKRFARGRKVKWVFTGGEPTLNPSFMDLVKYLRQQGHLLHVQSNGSRNAAYFSELIQYACLGFSYHFESANPDKFIENCTAVIRSKETHEQARLLWFGVRLMVGPGRLGEALQLRERILSIPGFVKHGNISFSPLYERMKPENLMEYTPEEFETIIRLA